MNKADLIFKLNIEDILNFGTYDENPRPKYESDGMPAYSKFITQVFEKYDINNNEFPITTLRPIAWKSGIKEIFWIYQEQTSELHILKEKYGIHWWDNWEVFNEHKSSNDEGDFVPVGSGTIGIRYGATVRRYNLMNKLLDGLKKDPFGRRHIISLWQEQDFADSEGLMPCAFQTIFTVRKHEGEYYLDMTLVQRSSDYLTAGHINKIQYVAFMMMVAKHCGYKAGTFAHFVQNLHIYDRHEEQARILLARPSSTKKPILKLNVPDGTNFYDITIDDFELVDYEPTKPQLKFELGV